MRLEIVALSSIVFLALQPRKRAIITVNVTASIFFLPTIIIWLITLPADKRWLSCSLALILGGAIRNLWDRVLLGYVIDFIEVYYQGWYWPAFNIADSAITVGAVMLIIDAFWFDDANVTTHTR